VRIEFAPRAVREAERGALWWRDNRPAAPTLFEEELREALDQIRSFPQLGSAYDAIPGVEHRRLLIPGTRYHVYYRIAEPDLVRVVAIWSSVRGRGPRL
jgi:plasmid stabilization system protein ParE